MVAGSCTPIPVEDVEPVEISFCVFGRRSDEEFAVAGIVVLRACCDCVGRGIVEGEYVDYVVDVNFDDVGIVDDVGFVDVPS